MKFLVPLLFFVLPAWAREPVVIKLWPSGAPGQIKTIAEPAKPNPTSITNVTDPTLTVYRPEKPNGTAIIVAPGGGFNHLAIAHEGTQVCEWLNSIGVTAGLLTYRTPTSQEAVPYEKPVQDAQRAIGILRHRATEWGIERIGLVGFSAGGSLAVHTALDRKAPTYPQDPSLDADPRLDFVAVIYGGGLLDPNEPTKLRSDVTVPADAPPAFFLVAHDDKTNPIAATLLYLEYKKQNLPAELHIFTKGGHGFGMRQNGQPVNEWPQRWAEWLKSLGLLGDAVGK
jgi:acetyl esterase/lipase